MFSKNVIESDMFLDMPLSTQALYFHLGMAADDDGFVTPNRILRQISATADDLKILVAKNYAIPFETGVLVIRHWNEHNYIPKDRYKQTIYSQERDKLLCIQNVYNLETQVGRVGREVSNKKGPIKKEIPDLTSIREKFNFREPKKSVL